MPLPVSTSPTSCPSSPRGVTRKRLKPTMMTCPYTSERVSCVKISARRQMIDAAQRVLDNFHDPRRTDDEVMPLRRRMAVWAQAMHCIAPIWRDHKEFKREFLTRPSTADL